jgi:predicted nucleic acid-binding protein
MSCWDSSALVKLYVQESDSAEFRELAVKVSHVATGSLDALTSAIAHRNLLASEEALRTSEEKGLRFGTVWSFFFTPAA